MSVHSGNAQPLGPALPRPRLHRLLLLAPLVLLFYKTFEHGLAPPFEAITSPDGLHALKLTLLTVAIAVPLNTIFGVVCSLLLVRHKWKGNWLIDAVINLPVRDLARSSSASRSSSSTATRAGSNRASPKPGSRSSSRSRAWSSPASSSRCPFVVRETVPVLQEIGTEQEQAA